MKATVNIRDDGIWINNVSVETIVNDDLMERVLGLATAAQRVHNCGILGQSETIVPALSMNKLGDALSSLRHFLDFAHYPSEDD